jgi:ABC-type sugar transport system ATPase subunit
MNTQTAPLIEVQSVSKIFGSVIALKDISMKVNAGELVCLLGDNGTGKSTLIKILSGVHQPSEGSQLFECKEKHFSSPPDALAMGTQVRETTQAVATLSGGERQSVAISRAVYFGAKVLILDEPTAALGVKKAVVVLRYIAQALSRGLRVIFITHNPIMRIRLATTSRFSQAQVVAAPMAFFPFSGWKESFFGDKQAHGRDAIEFYTEKKVVVERWPREWSRKF